MVYHGIVIRNLSRKNIRKKDLSLGISMFYFPYSIMISFARWALLKHFSYLQVNFMSLKFQVRFEFRSNLSREKSGLGQLNLIGALRFDTSVVNKRWQWISPKLDPCKKNHL